MKYDTISGIAGKYGAKILYDESIAEFTSFRIGGKCDVIVMPNSAECIAELVSECRKSGIRYYIFGKCTNVLIRSAMKPERNRFPDLNSHTVFPEVQAALYI